METSYSFSMPKPPSKPRMKRRFKVEVSDVLLANLLGYDDSVILKGVDHAQDRQKYTFYLEDPDGRYGVPTCPEGYESPEMVPPICTKHLNLGPPEKK